VIAGEEAIEMKFPRRKIQQYLNAYFDDHVIFNYQLKGLSPFMSASAESIAAGKATKLRQDAANKTYQVHSGSGKTVVTSLKGEITGLVWGSRDAFVVPNWYQFVLHADEGKSLYLFTFSDKAMQDN
jgi:gentisate 1,2-dioxygenase